MRERDQQPAMAAASRKLLGRSLIAASLGQQDPRAGTERRQIRALEAGAHGDVTRAAETGVWIEIGGMRRRGRQCDPEGGREREPLQPSTTNSSAAVNGNAHHMHSAVVRLRRSP